MGKIVNINGNPYTTAVEDVRMMQHKHQFREVLAQEVTAAMQRSRDGKVYVNIGALEHFLDQAYLMGREDGAGK